MENQSLSIPDDIFDRHFGGGAEDIDTTDVADGLDDDLGELPGESDESDNLDLGDGLDDPDSDDAPGTGDDLDDDEADAGDGEKPSGQANEPAEDEIPFDRKELEAIKDPVAKKAAERAIKGFQALVTKRTQELAEIRKTHEAEISEAQRYKDEYAGFIANLGTPEGGEHFLLTVAGKAPQLFTEDVLTDIALRSPDVFAQAYERSLELAEDPRARRVFDGERDIRIQKHREGQQQANQQQQAARQREQQIGRLVNEAAGSLGKEAVQLVRDSVDAFLARKARAKEKATAADVRAHAASVAKQINATKQDAAKAAERKGRKQRAADVRKQALASRSPRVQPAGTASPAGGGGKEWVRPERADDVPGALVDRFFGD